MISISAEINIGYLAGLRQYTVSACNVTRFGFKIQYPLYISRSFFFKVCIIAGTLGCVFIDNETHESGVTKCTTGEAWSAFSWHHSSVFRCQWTHNQVFLLLSHMLISNAKSIFIYVMKYVSGFIWKLGINFAVCITWIDETWWNNR